MLHVNKKAFLVLPDLVAFKFDGILKSQFINNRFLAKALDGKEKRPDLAIKQLKWHLPMEGSENSIEIE